MSPPILSLQALAENLKEQERSIGKLADSIDAKFESQRPTIDNLTMFYRTIIGSVFVALVVAFLTFIWPLASHSGVLLLNWVFPPTVEQPSAPSATNGPPGKAPLPATTTTHH